MHKIFLSLQLTLLLMIYFWFGILLVVQSEVVAAVDFPPESTLAYRDDFSIAEREKWESFYAARYVALAEQAKKAFRASWEINREENTSKVNNVEWGALNFSWDDSLASNDENQTMHQIRYIKIQVPLDGCVRDADGKLWRATPHNGALEFFILPKDKSAQIPLRWKLLELSKTSEIEKNETAQIPPTRGNCVFAIFADEIFAWEKIERWINLPLRCGATTLTFTRWEQKEFAQKESLCEVAWQLSWSDSFGTLQSHSLGWLAENPPQIVTASGKVFSPQLRIIPRGAHSVEIVAKFRREKSDPPQTWRMPIVRVLENYAFTF